MIGRPAGIARFPGVARSLPRRRSWLLRLPTRSLRNPIALILAPTGNRLWKCRRYGNHRTVSTAPWKSRKEREIPTFPQPIISVSQEEAEEEDEEEGNDMRDARQLDTRPPVKAR